MVTKTLTQMTAVAVVITALAITLALAGAFCLVIACRDRRYRLGYLGTAMLESAWVLGLITWGVRQPQWYAIPIGLYFTGVGYLERRQGRGPFATIVESFGLALLLLITFIQSLDGAQGLRYFGLFVVEGLIVIGWGASRRAKAPFFIGLAASVLNVVVQIVVLVRVYEVNRWFIMLGVGLLMVIVAALVERRRERIITRAQEWRDILETWK
ncbi:MAG: hypothetical protein GY832_06400 [Chloroflexi bacterium]|nr:hypothetical protein [Chloroflexota bacterium]